MARELISKKTRQVFREYFVGTTLGIIADEFDAAGIEPDRDFTPSTSGARRGFVEQHYHALDLTRTHLINASAGCRCIRVGESRGSSRRVARGG